MAETKKTTQTSEKMSEKKPVQTAQLDKASSKSRVIPVIVCVTLGLVLVSGWYQYSQNQQAQTTYNALKDKLNKIETDRNDLQKKYTELLNEVEATTKKAEQQFKALSDQFYSIKDQNATGQEDWQLLKSRFYLELAQVNAHWRFDQASTLAMMTQADDLLKQIQTPAIFEVRQLIAKESMTIKNTPKQDLAGVITKIDGIIAQVDTMSVPKFAMKTTNEPAQPEKVPANWKQRLNNSVHMLEKLVVVRNHNQDIKPILSPLYQDALRESIRMNLQEAQWALLHGNTKIYQSALNQAQKDITRSFATNESETKAVIEEINTMKAMTWNTKQPDISSILQKLNQVIKSQKNTDEKPAGDSKP